MHISSWALSALLLAAPHAEAKDAESKLSATIDRLWAAISHEPGQAADTAVLRRLFASDARVLGVNPNRERGRLRVQSATAFVESLSGREAEGFYEKEIFREIRVYGTLAHVLSTVESRTPRHAPASAIGVNSLQLHFDGAEWRIVSLYYHLEDPAQPIPSGYRR